MHKRAMESAPAMANPLGLDARVVAEGPTAQLMTVSLPPGGRIPPHPAGMVVDFIVLEGRGVAIEGAVREDVITGDVIRFEPGDPHGFEASDDGPMRLLAIKHG